MPRKRKAGTAKPVRKTQKQQELYFAQTWVDFFNQDPVEYFRNHHALKSEFAKIARNPKAQETLRQSFKQVADSIKAVIVAYEDFWQGRAKEDGLKPLLKAAKALDELIEIKVIYKLGVSNAGAVSDDPVVFESKSQIDFVLPSVLTLIANKVGNFKDWLDQHKEHFPIGVCRYPKCRIFFVKDRKDKRYCKPTHASNDPVRRLREKEKTLLIHSFGHFGGRYPVKGIALYQSLSHHPVQKGV